MMLQKIPFEYHPNVDHDLILLRVFCRFKMAFITNKSNTMIRQILINTAIFFLGI